MPWIMNSVDYLVFKGEAIKWINQRLGDPVQAVSDVTMGVIMCLASWEVSLSYLSLFHQRHKSKESKEKNVNFHGSGPWRASRVSS